jgi:hypothetical protein
MMVRQDITDTLALLDWIDLLDGLVGDLTHPGCARIAFTRHAGWSGGQVEDYLGRYHVKIWGRWFSKDTLSLSVKKEQKQWAEYLLLRAGVPVVSIPMDPRNAGWAARHDGPPPAWDDAPRKARPQTQKRRERAGRKALGMRTRP